jgi:hypothetical protein
MEKTTHFEADEITVHVLEVVPEKGEGFTMVVEIPPHITIPSDAPWKAVLGDNFRGATQADNLWHLYCREKPPFSAGATFSISNVAAGD